MIGATFKRKYHSTSQGLAKVWLVLRHGLPNREIKRLLLHGMSSHACHFERTRTVPGVAPEKRPFCSGQGVVCYSSTLLNNTLNTTKRSFFSGSTLGTLSSVVREDACSSSFRPMKFDHSLSK